jgi:hypothetical protein
VIKKLFIFLYELEKIFYIVSKGINCEILVEYGMGFEKGFQILIKKSMIMVLRTNRI